MSKLRRKTTEERLHGAAEDAFPFLIAYDGLRYHRNGYRYDRLEDAVAYASLMQSRPTQVDIAGPYKPGVAQAAPTDAEQVLMDTLGIRLDQGSYRFRGFRYDGLSDAVNFAQRQRSDRS